ncbi:MAG TPA: hypothetical protein VFZ61_08565 [Polyangiales bacterium]
MSEAAPIARRNAFLGLFMVTLATLMYEILLTRIFSATVFYHFAFVALSIALFGMTVGALIVYLMPERFRDEDVSRQLAVYSLGFAISILVTFLIHLAMPLWLSNPVGAVLTVAVKYLVISVPFVFSGVCVCLALTRFPTQVSKMYAADLVGSSVGCLVVLATLHVLDAPTAVVLVAVMAALGAGFFAAEVSGGALRRWSYLFAGACLTLAMVNTGMAHAGASLLRLRWVKFQQEGELLHERWNSFSRITVEGDPDKPLAPHGWGLSARVPKEPGVPQLKLQIDGLAGTALTKFDGKDFNSVAYLRYDVTNVVHSIRPNSDVLVVGVGGGRDILSALYFNQKSVTGVELNQTTLNTINDRFGDFTGHLDQDPRVRFENDEARAFVARQERKVDIIEASLTDTWAATAAGAFVLSENNLYTVEAFDTFLDHLNPRGVLSVSRWYQKDMPAEAYRLTALAFAALRERGIKNPQDHIFLVTQLREEGDWMVEGEVEAPPEGIGTSTLLVSNEPFNAEDMARLDKLTGEMGFEQTLTPRGSDDKVLAAMAKAEDLDAFAATYPLDISPPRDDRPFFFYLFRVGDFASWNKEQGMNDPNRLAMLTLALLLGVVVVLTSVCIVVPLWLKSKRGALQGSWSLVVFFACLGLGFMTLEIAQMQRLNIFLGHPTYGLSVVLFSLLLSSGLGSFTTSKVSLEGGVKRLVGLLIVLLIVGLLTPVLTRALEPTPLPVHILVSVLLLFPMGFFLGMAFPLGMKAAQERASELAPWFWGINGATSVCASVLAIIVAINFGVAVTFWTGAVFYLIALGAYVRRLTPSVG